MDGYLPDEIGLDLHTAYRPRGDGTVTVDGRIIGRPAWAVDDVYDDVRLIDRFRAKPGGSGRHQLRGLRYAANGRRVPAP